MKLRTEEKKDERKGKKANTCVWWQLSASAYKHLQKLRTRAYELHTCAQGSIHAELHMYAHSWHTKLFCFEISVYTEEASDAIFINFQRLFDCFYLFSLT